MQRSTDAPTEAVWELLTSHFGVGLWLGKGARARWEIGASYRTSDGTSGEVRSFHPAERIRLSYRTAEMKQPSIVQVTLQARGTRTAVRFHQERLTSAAERERWRSHWKGVLDALTQRLERGSGGGTKTKALAATAESTQTVVENVNTPGRTTRVDAAKYADVRSSMLEVLPPAEPGLTFQELVDAVLPLLPDERFPGGATARWWVKTVQLDLEAKQQLAREATRPLRWHRVGGRASARGPRTGSRRR